MIDWQDLQFLLAFARHDSLSAAADNLGVNRTTVARRLDHLEGELGTKLVERVGRDLLLTQAGREALSAAEHIRGEIQTLERHVSGRDQRPEGVVRLTTTPRLAVLLGPDLSRFGEAFPRVMLEVSATNANENLDHMDADVAVRLTSNPPEHLVGRKLAEPTSALYANPAMAAALPGLTQVNYLGSELDRQGTMQLREQLGVEANLVLQSNSMDLLAELVAAGRGLAMLPCYIGEPDERLSRVSEPWRVGMPDLWLLYHPRARNLHRVRVFTGFLLEVFEALRPRLEGQS